MFKNIIDDFTLQTKTENLGLKDILFRLFENQELKDKYINEIRRSTVIGQIANEILANSGSDQACKILAIGDIKYFGEHEEKWNRFVKNALNQINPTNLVGYDLTSQGSSELRDAIFDYIKLYYQFDLNKSEVADEIIPTYGGTDGFVTVLDSIRTLYSGKKINFIFPESSFMANVKIAENILGIDSLKIINKPSGDNFFITKQDIEKLNIGENDINVFYITSVGNPTGMKIGSTEFYGLIEYISKINNSVIILDNVYVGLLKSEVSLEMFKDIFLNINILQRIIFTESLSKTLGTTGLRLGWIWSLNIEFSQELKKNVILKKAGFSRILDEFIVNLLSNKEEIIQFQNEVYSFWAKQRYSFYEYISSNFPRFFDFESSCKLVDREGIYILLKVREGFSATEIFAETGIIGVGITLSDGLYIRYAFGNVNYF